jgi:hypothetical protein
MAVKGRAALIVPGIGAFQRSRLGACYARLLPADCAFLQRPVSSRSGEAYQPRLLADLTRLRTSASSRTSRHAR